MRIDVSAAIDGGSGACARRSRQRPTGRTVLARDGGRDGCAERKRLVDQQAPSEVFTAMPSCQRVPESRGSDVGAVGSADARAAGGEREQRRRAPSRQRPASSASWSMNAQRRYAGHLAHQHVVFGEVAARRVEHRRAVRDALRDDAVAGLGDDDVGGATRSS